VSLINSLITLYRLSASFIWPILVTLNKSWGTTVNVRGNGSKLLRKINTATLTHNVSCYQKFGLGRNSSSQEHAQYMLVHVSTVKN
jgi:hypothetical protein